MIAFQSRFVVHNVVAYAGGLMAGSGVMLIGGYPAFAILFGSAGIVRFARRAGHRALAPRHQHRDLGHAARRRRPAGVTRFYLRDCASSEILAPMIEMPATAPDQCATAAPPIAKALADAKRLCVVERLAEGERSVSELSRDVGCQVPNMSQHLAVLRAAGIVATRREGNTVFYRLADPQVLEMYRLLQQFAG